MPLRAGFNRANVEYTVDNGMYLDVDGDLYHSPLDVLVLINFINSGARFQVLDPAPSGEGESSLFANNISMVFPGSEVYPSSNENSRKRVTDIPFSSMNRKEPEGSLVVAVGSMRKPERAFHLDPRTEIEDIVEELDSGLDDVLLELLTSNFQAPYRE